MTPGACQAQGVSNFLVSDGAVSLFFPRKISHYLVALLLKRMQIKGWLPWTSKLGSG